MFARLGLTRQRITGLIPLLFGITVITFLIIRLVPGDPAQQILGNRYTPQAGAELNRSLGLDAPIWQQYLDFLRSAVTGNLGYSYFYKTSVGSLVGARLVPTLALVGVAAVFTAALSVPVGVISALRRGGVFDQTARVVATIGFALPSFLLGIILILIFGVKLNTAPIGGWGTGFGDHLFHLVLPGVTLAIPFSTVLIRSLRASTITVLESDHVTTARLKGIGPVALLARHVVRNSVISVVVVFGINLAFLLGGTVVVENVFSIPGLGSLLVSSVSTRDYPVVQAVALLFAFFVVAVNLLTDVVHAALDPRLAASRRLAT